jgi:hypothetical protein
MLEASTLTRWRRLRKHGYLSANFALSLAAYPRLALLEGVISD